MAADPGDAVELLRRALAYDPATGIFTWREDGSVAGAPRDERGYIRIGLQGQRWHAHRLAFLYMTGGIPPFVDHIDGNKSNNKWSNLRGATKSQNGMNRGPNKGSATGVKGVYFQANAYVAEVWVDRRKHYIGRFSTLEKAAVAIASARARLHGEFAHG